VPRLCLLLPSLAVALSGCGSGDEGLDVEKARTEAGFEVLWLGEKHAGHELESLEVGERRAGLTYGTCEIKSTGTDGGCALPFELQEEDACDGFSVAGRFKPQPGPGASATYGEGGGRVVLTGTTYVKIFGENLAQAIKALRPLGSDEPLDRLPPPAPGLLEHRRC